MSHRAGVLKADAAGSVRPVLRSSFQRGRLSLLVLPLATGKAEFHAVSSFRLTIRVQLSIPPRPARRVQPQPAVQPSRYSYVRTHRTHSRQPDVFRGRTGHRTHTAPVAPDA